MLAKKHLHTPTDCSATPDFFRTVFWSFASDSMTATAVFAQRCDTTTNLSIARCVVQVSVGKPDG